MWMLHYWYLKKIIASVDLFVTFARVKEVCQERLIYNSEVSTGFLATALCYRMCVVICLLPCLDDNFSWLPLSMSLMPKHFWKRLSDCDRLAWFLGHAYGMMVSNTAKNECSNYLVFEMFTLSWTGCRRGNLWIWIEPEKPLRLQNSQMVLI